MRINSIIILLAVAFLQFSCAGYYDTVMKSNDVDLKYKAAHEYFQKGKYKKAADIFDNLNLLVQGLPQEDTVTYYHGLSNYRYGDYETAETSLAKFIEVYPRSPFIEEAKYLRIDCLYRGTYRYELDQTPTRKAMMVISEFMYDNPGSKYYPVCQEMMKDLMERLERKSFESAKIYYTGKKFPSTVALNKLYYFMPYIKGKGIKDLYFIKIARVGTRKEGQPDNDPNDLRLVFEIEFVKQLFEDYKKVHLDIWQTFKDTILDKVI